MGVYEHLDGFGGLPLFRFTEETDPDGTLPPAGRVAWSVSTSFDSEPFADVFARFMRTVDTAGITALIIGYWGASYDTDTVDPVALLTEAAASFDLVRWTS